jgi:hypothetical protein
MSKKDHYIEIQKGPISMKEQYRGKFCPQDKMTREDMQNITDRRAGMTLTEHEPKR